MEPICGIKNHTLYTKNIIIKIIEFMYNLLLKFIIINCDINNHFASVPYEIWTMSLEVTKSNFYHSAHIS